MLKCFYISAFILLFSALVYDPVSAHCDSMDGPVVKAAKKSLETGNLNYVLIWVAEEDEKEISILFGKVLKVRELGDEAAELADNYFFETVVRVHRMGEGVPYTGLKPAGYKPEKGIEAADTALEQNSIDAVLVHLEEKDQAKVKELFQEVSSKKNFDINDVQAGREYTASYVHFIHYVEELYNGHQEAGREVHH